MKRQKPDYFVDNYLKVTKGKHNHLTMLHQMDHYTRNSQALHYRTHFVEDLFNDTDG